MSANLAAASMIRMPYQKSTFNAVVDVFSGYCLNEQEFSLYLDEVARVSAPGARFFSYVPSKNSDAFKNYKPARKVDESTLDGIFRMTAPYAGNAYPFRLYLRPSMRMPFMRAAFELLERAGREFVPER